jgi:hypothetical protein
MELLKSQNEILERQNVLLLQICAFITPVSSFFAALKNFVVFMAWLVGVVMACLAAWQAFVAWIKTH